ncbi:MAG TPA: hypothetical protein PKC30_08905 [Saprospiraceae bacterium]|nr:hypothetical protein [Saprospiraceae bacterium]
MDLYKLLFFIFFICFYQNIYSQVKTTGIVLDQNEQPVTQANVLVYKSIKGDFLGFGVTRQDGTYAINIAHSLDSILIQVEHLSYESYFIKVKSNEYQKIILIERITELPEVKITHDRIQRRGDTIIYDVVQFKNVNDVNIEDIIRRLPGIEIQDDGRIFYNREPISHFYIEGLDMLGGRYKIATRALNIDAVREIQVLEHHQHIKALKDIVVPSSAAINLKLKSGITHTGQYEGGAGFTPLLYNVKGTLFGFSKNYQYNVIGAGNNIGIDNSDLFQVMTFVIMDGQNTGWKRDLLDVTLPIKPRLRNQMYRMNNEQAVGINFLKKLNNDLQFKYNASAHQDKLRWEGGNIFDLYDQTGTYTISETISTINRIRGMDHSLKLETNKDKVFFLADILGETLPSTNTGDHFINNTDVVEYLKKSLVNVSADMKFILRKGLQAYRINSYIEYQNNNDTLNIMPTSFILPDAGLLSVPSANQIMRQQLVKSHTYTSFLARINQFKYGLSAGIKTRHVWLKSGLEGVDSQISEQFHNDIFNGATSLYTNQEIKREMKYWSYGLKLPVSLQFISLQNSENPNTLSRHQFLVYQPSASLSYKFSYKYNTSISISYSNNADYQQLYYDRYILTSNRNISRRLPEVFQSQGLNLSSSHMFSNLLKGNDRSFISFNWNKGSQNQLQNNNFNSTSIVLDVVNQENKVNGWGSSGMFKSEVFTRNLVFELNYNLTVNYTDQILNDDVLRTRTDFWFIHTSIDFTPFDRLGLKANINFNRFATNFAPPSNNTTYSGQIYINPYKNIDWRFNFDLVHNKSVNQNTLNSVFGSEIQYKLSPQKLSFSLQVYNLTNTTDYQSIRQTIFQLHESFLRLRPRQVFLSVKKLI